jgi:hypothetical protein
MNSMQFSLFVYVISSVVQQIKHGPVLVRIKDHDFSLFLDTVIRSGVCLNCRH